MQTIDLNTFEKAGLDSPKLDCRAKLATLNERFKTSVYPQNGSFGTLESIKDDGTIERVGKNEQGFTFKEYLNNDRKLQKLAEKLEDGRWRETSYDDNGTAYMQSTARYGGVTVKDRETILFPNTEIVKRNMTTITDSDGRPISSTVKNLTDGHQRDSLYTVKQDSSYQLTDDKGDLIPKRFGGRTSPENIVPQFSNVNRGAIKRVENIAAKLNEQGKTVDYQIKTNYSDNTKRPSSFEPIIRVDGKVHDLPGELKKIYNSANTSSISKFKTNIGEKFGKQHEIGTKSGLAAASITTAISTVENVRSVISGEITAQDAFIDVAKDSGTAFAVGYGTGFISSSVAKATATSSRALIRTLGKANVPAAAIAFGIDSYDSVARYAQGKITGERLAYDLGESAVGIAGSIGGAALAGAAIGSIVPGVGTVVGVSAGLVGGMVGYAVATGAYATAIEVAIGGTEVLTEKVGEIADTAGAIAETATEVYTVVSNAAVEGAQLIGNAAVNLERAAAQTFEDTVAAVVENADALKNKAIEMGQGVIDLVASTMPEAVDSIKSAMNDFASNLGISFNL